MAWHGSRLAEALPRPGTLARRDRTARWPAPIDGRLLGEEARLEGGPQGSARRSGHDSARTARRPHRGGRDLRLHGRRVRCEGGDDSPLAEEVLACTRAWRAAAARARGTR